MQILPHPVPRLWRVARAGMAWAVMHACRMEEGKRDCFCCQGAPMRRTQGTGAATIENKIARLCMPERNV